MTRSEPWYREGLRFSCRQCGACCTGDPGYVFLRRGEAAAIAASLAMKEKEFRRVFTRKAGGRTSLKEESDGRCVFYDEGCRVYDVRPVQCRTFPFWYWNLAKRENWETVAGECPGMNRGCRYSREEIEDLAAKRVR
jgi:Fe-S-cluster containining protein